MPRRPTFYNGCNDSDGTDIMSARQMLSDDAANAIEAWGGASNFLISAI